MPISGPPADLAVDNIDKCSGAEAPKRLLTFLRHCFFYRGPQIS
jgi:hypothetical protein